MDTAEFYSKLGSFTDFLDVTDQDYFWTLPDDWLLVVADVSNSTEAVSKGELKAVNIVGVSVITAIRNIVAPLEIPYIFGGDGASLCIPGKFREPTVSALLATRAMAKQQFDLDLRVGIVSLEEIARNNLEVRIAKQRISSHYCQAAFSGGGIEYAESLLKSASEVLPGIDSQLANHTANYAGLECRWNQVDSMYGETIAVIIRATTATQAGDALVYQQVLNTIDSIYGEAEKCRPVHSSRLKTTYNRHGLNYEARIHSARVNRPASAKYYWEVVFRNLLGWLLMTFRIRASGVRWGNYKQDLVTHTDFRKFDGTLRQVISGTRSQREQLAGYLEALHQEGQCRFGIHVSNAALITCMIDSRDGEHYHFVDGAGGGYTLAAEAMKRQLEMDSS
ncbi:MAG: DUF3095 domain-containing protein [Proteobacteria bacterium]|nr:DUF3095 domain-containing protein [Pseudomonadota bacterium]